ncbi:MAG: sensor histidine kinase [Acidimicrobiia bacterium]
MVVAAGGRAAKWMRVDAADAAAARHPTHHHGSLTMMNSSLDQVFEAAPDLLLVAPWLLLIGLATRGSSWFPIEGRRAVRHFAVHVLLAATGLVVVHTLSAGQDRPRGGDDRSTRVGADPVRFRPAGPPPGARLAVAALLYAATVSAAHAATSSRRAREREQRAKLAESQLPQARLMALQMQLNPHFLFNALNGVSALVHTDPHAADRAIGSLSAMLRAALDSADAAEIPLSRELQLLEQYLSLERTRFGGRLTFEQQVQPDAADALVPTFMLQPLVENAVKHGIAPMRAPGTIRITVHRAADRLKVSVANTGVPWKERLRSSKSHGVGLANTSGRLDQLCPNDYSIDVSSSESFGCIVTLDIPYRAA